MLLHARNSRHSRAPCVCAEQQKMGAADGFGHILPGQRRYADLLGGKARIS